MDFAFMVWAATKGCVETEIIPELLAYFNIDDFALVKRAAEE